jgi:hypothetical protein
MMRTRKTMTVSTPSHIILRQNLILSSHLLSDLPNRLFPSVLPTKILYEFLIYRMRATCTPI